MSSAESFTLPSHIQALIFDLDGTLADTMPLHVEAWLQTARAYKFHLTAQTIQDWAGMPTLEVIKRLKREQAHAMDPAEVKTYKDQAVHQLKQKGIPPIKPIMELAEQYHRQLPLGIGTGSNRDEAEFTLSAIKAHHLFQAVITADDVLRHKPAPDTYLLCAQQLGVPPKNCLVFEDGDMGIQAAEQAGMDTVDVRPWLQEAQ